MQAVDFLNLAEQILKERGAERNQSSGERNMEKIVSMFNTLTGNNLSTSDGWKFMILLKIVRAETGQYKQDDYIDGCSYFSLLGEEKSKNGNQKIDDGNMEHSKRRRTRRNSVR